MIWHVALTKYVEIALLCFLGSGRDGAVDVACIDSLTGGIGRGVLVLLPSGLRRHVDDISLRKIIGGSDFDPVASLIGYSPLCDVDWAVVDSAQRFYPYEFSFAQIYHVLEPRLMSESRNSGGSAIPESDVESLHSGR